MGILSDLVVADEGDAEAIATAPVPSRAFDGIDIKGIDSVKFSTLHSLVTNRPYAELISEYEPVVTASEEGPWVFSIPPELVTRLADLSEAERRSVGEEWARTDEFKMDLWDAHSVLDALEAICDEARKAVSSRRSLFLWMSL